jgi:hypothetical protein
VEIKHKAEPVVPQAGRCDREAEQGETRGSLPEHLEALGDQGLYNLLPVDQIPITFYN